MDAASNAVDASGDREKIAIMEAVADWFYGFYDMDKKTRMILPKFQTTA